MAVRLPDIFVIFISEDVPVSVMCMSDDIPDISPFPFPSMG